VVQYGPHRKDGVRVPDWMVSLAVNVLIQIARDPSQNSRWRKALLKVFKEIGRAFATDDAFADVMRETQS